MSRIVPPRSHALAAIVLSLAAPSAAIAGAPYDGWRGQSYSAPSYDYGSDRRPFDGSYRTEFPSTHPTVWNGLYLGADIGGGFGDVDSKSFIHDDNEFSGVLGGIHAGYNAQYGMLVAGFEVDASWAGLTQDATAAAAMQFDCETDWLSTARLRLGYATGSTLFYVTGGLAVSDLDLTSTSAGLSSTASETLVGYAIGAGVEYKFRSNMSARIEALYHGFGEEALDLPSGKINLDTDITTIRAGLSISLD